MIGIWLNPGQDDRTGELVHKVRHGVEDDDELYCEEWVRGRDDT